MVHSFASPDANPQGVTWDGKTLWINDSTVGRIYQVDPFTGAVIRSFASPGTQPRGLAFDGKYLWHSDDDADLIYQIAVA